MDNTTGIADQQLVKHLYRVLPSALVLAIDQDNHNTKITAEQVVRNMEAAGSIDAAHATDIRNRNQVDNALNYAKVKELALQHAL